MTTNESIDRSDAEVERDLARGARVDILNALFQKSAEIERLRNELEQANADCKRANELINAVVDDYNEAIAEIKARAEAYEQACVERDNWKQRYEDTLADYVRLHDEKMDAIWPDTNLELRRRVSEARAKAIDEAACIADVYAYPSQDYSGGEIDAMRGMASNLAAAIRALSEAEGKEG